MSQGRGRSTAVPVSRALLEDIARRLYAAGDDLHREQVEALLDFTPAHPEHVCQDCGGPNPAWSANNAWWNRVMGSPNGIVCPTCFITRAGGAFRIVPGPGGEVT